MAGERPDAPESGRERTINVDEIARVEGEGALTIRLRGEEVASVELRIFEPPRLFEALLRGRAAAEAPDITARICGICPVAYQMSACLAVEDALGIAVPAPVRALRRLLYCGEWIESHALHMFLLHAPDFLGYPDAIAMARDHKDLVLEGLALKKAGNAIMTRVGGREIHPVNVRVGGFYRAPSRADLRALLPDLERSREAMRGALRRFAGLPFPEAARDWECVALAHPTEYPILEGRIASTGGLDIAPREWDAHFVEEHVARSTALHARIRARGRYLCGPIARFNLNAARLSPLAREAAREVGLAPPVQNPWRSILVRAVETLHALEEATRLIEAYEPPDPPFVEAPPLAGEAFEVVGHGATEAPRGLLYHRYRIGPDGIIREARIVPPTSQNQASIEDDLRALAPRLAAAGEEEARALAERAVRNHDPCISCATHFLRVRVERG